MPFKEKRAQAFARYTLSGMVKNGALLTMTKSEFADALKVEKLWESHIDTVRKEAARWGIAVVQMAGDFGFFEFETIKRIPANTKVAVTMTDKFENLFGSDAAEEAWEEWVK